MAKINIIQQAIVLIGNNPGNTTSSSLDNKLANRVFDYVVTWLMQRTQWNFSNKVSDLNKLAETSKFTQYQNVFQLPTDFFSVDTKNMEKFFFNNSYNYNCNDYISPFLIVGSKYYSNAETVKLYYFTDEENSLSGSNFEQALIYALASRICLAVTKDQNLSKTLLEQSENQTQQAMVQNKLTNKQTKVIRYDGFTRG